MPDSTLALDGAGVFFCARIREYWMESETGIMRMSELLLKTQKHVAAEIELPSHQLLVRAGLVQRVAAGIYSLTPLGRRAIRRIEAIVREEMERVGGQEVLLPVVQPAELWQESGRYHKIGDELARFWDRGKRPMVLALTHEEAATTLVRAVVESYQQLPLLIFQIQTKFRDEARPRAGLIRLREFLMKDAYSFHATRADLDIVYERTVDAYRKIFQRLELPVLSVEADNGMMGGWESHEFMVLAEGGEDTLLICPHCGYAANAEISPVGAGQACVRCQEALVERRGIEVGHTFKLGTVYSAAMGATFIAQDGSSNHPMIMACYGIGISRLLACVIEQHHDQNGIVWPASVAPYAYHLLAAGNDSAAHEVAEALYHQLGETATLYDDRDMSAGVKLKDADLLGMPVRLTVTKRSLAAGGAELRRRDTGETRVVSLPDARIAGGESA